MSKILNYCKKHSVLKRTFSEIEKKRKFGVLNYSIYLQQL